VIEEKPLPAPESQNEPAPVKAPRKRLTKAGIKAKPQTAGPHTLHPSRLIGIKGASPRSVPILRTLPPYCDTTPRTGVNRPKLSHTAQMAPPNESGELRPLHEMTGEEFANLTPERVLEYDRALHRHAWNDWTFADELKTPEGRKAIHRVAIRYEFNSDSSPVPVRVLQSHALEAPAYNAHCWFARELSERQESPSPPYAKQTGQTRGP
jgi:hypothetical protein